MPRLSEEVAKAALASNEEFRKKLGEALRELGVSYKEFAKASRIPSSTLYKVLAGVREPSLSTLRSVVNALRRFEKASVSGKVVAVVAARPTLERLGERVIRRGEEVYVIREYPALSIEECIIAAVRAEQEGADVIVCAPIVSATIEKIVKTPIVTIVPEEDLRKAIYTAIEKASKLSP